MNLTEFELGGDAAIFPYDSEEVCERERIKRRKLDPESKMKNIEDDSNRTGGKVISFTPEGKVFSFHILLFKLCVSIFISIFLKKF